MNLELPVPPSVNHCWRFTSKGVFKKPEYIRWLQEASVAATLQQVSRVSGPVAVTVGIHPGNGWNIRRDIDNVLKCTLDFLHASGGDSRLIDGDDCRTLQRVLLIVRPVREFASITVRVKTIKNPVIIQTKAEAKRTAAAVHRQRKAGTQKPTMETITSQPVENVQGNSIVSSLDELREIARASKVHGKDLAQRIAKRHRAD